MNSTQNPQPPIGSSEYRPAILMEQHARPASVPGPADSANRRIEPQRLAAACEWTYECLFMYAAGQALDIVLSYDETAPCAAQEKFHLAETAEESAGGTTWTLTLRRIAGSFPMRSIALIPENDGGPIAFERAGETGDAFVIRCRRDETQPGDLACLRLVRSGLNVLQYERAKAGVQTVETPMSLFATSVAPLLECADPFRIDWLPETGGPSRSMEQSLLTLFEMLFGTSGAKTASQGHHARLGCEYRYHVAAAGDDDDDARLEVSLPVMLGDFDSTEHAAFARSCASQIALWSRQTAAQPDAVLVFGLSVFGRCVSGQPPVLRLTQLLLPVSAELDLS